MWFLGVLAIAAIAGAITSPGNGAGIIKIAFLILLAWGIWRAFVALWLLLSPVRKTIKPIMDPVNNHLDSTLRRSGLGALVNAGKKLQSGLEGAVKATQAEIDRRNKP
jgi:hypothetical protein